MDKIFETASKNTAKAWQIIENTDILNIWKSVGTDPYIVGSLKTGLLMKHLDIDIHVYSYPINIVDSFAAIAKLAENEAIKQITYNNLIDTEEECIEWHAWYEDDEKRMWQFDIIHILRGSFFDGHAEKLTDRILQVITPETKEAILRLKYETPDTEKIPGIYYYHAVIGDGIRTYPDFTEWIKTNQSDTINLWMP